MHGILIIYCQNCRYFHSTRQLPGCSYPNGFSFWMPVCLACETVSCWLRVPVLHWRSRYQKGVGGKDGRAPLEQYFILLLQPLAAYGKNPPVSGKGGAGIKCYLKLFPTCCIFCFLDCGSVQGIQQVCSDLVCWLADSQAGVGTENSYPEWLRTNYLPREFLHQAFLVPYSQTLVPLLGLLLVLKYKQELLGLVIS